MASADKSKSTSGAPLDLLAVIRASGVLNEKLLADIRQKILQGDYPMDSIELADRLVDDNVITSYQAKRFLNNKPGGLLVGRYVILDRIGSGSMGRVYKAHHMMMDRTVAIKIIAPEISSNERVVSRFQREMKLVGRLDHPNVVRAYDADRMNKVLFIVMEYVPGLSLGERLRKGPLPPLEVVEYAAQACQGLAHAHGQGIVHRDIKPSNLLLTGDRKIKVLDLGLGVLMEADSSATFATADGIAVGTVDYMSPEQACGREVDGRTDIYGLGCTMYHLATGKLPFPGETPIERLGKRISGRHTPITEYLSDVPTSFVRVLDRMLAPKPAERYATAAEAAEALANLIRPRQKAPAQVVTAPVAEAERPASVSPPITIKVEPVYPGWFRGFARLAENRPGIALAATVATGLGLFGAGLALGILAF